MVGSAFPENSEPASASRRRAASSFLPAGNIPGWMEGNDNTYSAGSWEQPDSDDFPFDSDLGMRKGKEAGHGRCEAGRNSGAVCGAVQNAVGSAFGDGTCGGSAVSADDRQKGKQERHGSSGSVSAGRFPVGIFAAFFPARAFLTGLETGKGIW